MLSQQRRTLILEEIRRTGAVKVSELVGVLGVSDMTVRRDLDILDRHGLIEKVHGGAIASRTPSSAIEPGFDAKVAQQQEEKQAIAIAATLLVEDGMAIGLSAGTTTWVFAHHLHEVSDLTIVTNSIRIADVLQQARPDRTVVLTGGIRTPSDALVGPIAVDALSHLHLDIVFMGVHGMDSKAGFTTPNLMEAETDRALASAGSRLVVLADHTKWRTIGLSTIARLDEAAVLVTDSGLPADARAVLANHVGELVLTPTPPS